VVRAVRGVWGAEKITSPQVKQAVQQFLDSTFKDRLYTGGHEPQQLKCMAVHGVFFNKAAVADYEEYKARLRSRRGKCGKLSDAIISRNPPSVLASGLDESLNEYLMFHGTDPESARGIIETDFKLPKSSKNGQLYGPGIYVAESSTKSHMYCKPNENGWVPILIVRILLGEIHNTVEDRPNVADLKQGCNSGKYDSICGDRRKIKYNFSGWREFIVYNPAAAVAEWLVWCAPK